LSNTPVSQYNSLPAELKAGAIKAAYESALVAGTGGNYEDGETRYFNCQTCHMRPVTGQGCNKNPPVRADLPLHDMTGGNYWIPDAMLWLDDRDKLLLGGGLTVEQRAAITDGKTRAMKQLSEAVALSLNGNTLRVVNLTGHKVITGYPEGRRMWLNIKWYDNADNLIREDGKYGPITVTLKEQEMQVNTLLDLHDPNTKVYEAHYGMTRTWANQLRSLGYSVDIVLAYDRITGQPTLTLGQLAAMPAGSKAETFHFAINNVVVKDNRIPPYRFDYNEAKKRNALPVPSGQYGNPSTGGVFNYWDEIALTPPTAAAYATINMVYQPTSWEYVQFLYLANNGSNAFLADEGKNLLDAWLATGMAEPYVMATTTWGVKPLPPTVPAIVSELGTWASGKRGQLTAASSFGAGSTVLIKAKVADNDGVLLSGAQVFAEIKNSDGSTEIALQGFTDENGVAELKWKTSRRQALGTYTATVNDLIKSGYEFDSNASTTSVAFEVVK